MSVSYSAFGVDVRVKILGTLHQKYFGYSGKDKQEVNSLAEEYNKKLLEQKASGKYANFEIRSSTTNTGVTGITYKITPDSVGYLIPTLTLSLSGYRKSVRLTRHSFEEGWGILIDTLCKKRMLNKEQKALLLTELMPNEAELAS